MRNKIKLHLGCGRHHKKGYLNCDISKEVNPDKIVDLEKKLPFKEDSVEEIVIEHCLEHIKNLHQLLEEMYRVCHRGAHINIKVPYFSSESAFSTMTHIRFFTYTSFDFLDSRNPVHYDSPKVDMRATHKRIVWRPPLKFLEHLFNLFPRVYQEIFCWIFPAKELWATLEVIK